ncbi:potassium uptake protein, TrkH family [Heliorestis convoluta]|uniref:Potassium uptake protein, TrkH family n=2 Tax=Heliorestis convoluta TaxID=356322 RepID=A0A5Q2N4E8_9FIRM|nr:potassium uptake protein, TrkH family [Heliorestis convoluta]
MSYLLVNMVGTLLLLLPWSSAQPGRATLLEAWFTATSALTVTGLIVVPTDTYWSIWGHTVILFLMQIGGLGLMVIATLLLTALGMKIQLGHRALIAQERNHFSLTGVVKLVQSVLILTLLIELIGVIALALLLPGLWDNGWFEGFFFTLFHTVSAFNGAGFDLTGESLAPYKDYSAVVFVFTALILIGSLGFVVLQELFVMRNWRRLSLHSRLVLWVTAAIALVGAFLYLITAYSRGLEEFSWTHQMIYSLFQSITRTAGFTTEPVTFWADPYILLMILMMFIGASPGSVGGGIKTTTFGTIILAVWAFVRGRKEVVIFEREIAADSVMKAFTVAVTAALLVFISTLLLMLIEGLPFKPVLFEVVSALATVGLSMGITADLSPFGQVVIGLLMLVGRIGVLSLITILAGKEIRRVRYMKESILIG